MRRNIVFPTEPFKGGNREKSGNQTPGVETRIDPDVPPRGFSVPFRPLRISIVERGGTIMDISEDCWEHVGLLQEVSAAEPPPPPPAPDFLIQQQEVSSPFLFLRSRDRALFGRYDSGEKSAGDWTRYSFFCKVSV